MNVTEQVESKEAVKQEDEPLEPKEESKVVNFSRSHILE